MLMLNERWGLWCVPAAGLAWAPAPNLRSAGAASAVLKPLLESRKWLSEHPTPSQGSRVGPRSQQALLLPPGSSPRS